MMAERYEVPDAIELTLAVERNVDPEGAVFSHAFSSNITVLFSDERQRFPVRLESYNLPYDSVSFVHQGGPQDGITQWMLRADFEAATGIRLRIEPIDSQREADARLSADKPQWHAWVAAAIAAAAIGTAGLVHKTMGKQEAKKPNAEQRSQ